MSFTLVIPGPPKGKARVRFVRATGRTYTPEQTLRAEQRVEQAWREAGSPFLDGPLSIDVEVIVERPGSHWRVKADDGLTAAGLRAPIPVRKPDLDNVLKLVADSLNGCAYKDDQQIVAAKLSRRWAARGERERVVVSVASASAGVHQLGRRAA